MHSLFFHGHVNRVFFSSWKAFINLLTGTGKGLFGGDDRVVYWKCEAGQELQENLTIPFNNQAREKALLLASQQVGSSHFSWCTWGFKIFVVINLSLFKEN